MGGQPQYVSLTFSLILIYVILILNAIDFVIVNVIAKFL